MIYIYALLVIILLTGIELFRRELKKTKRDITIKLDQMIWSQRFSTKREQKTLKRVESIYKRGKR